MKSAKFLRVVVLSAMATFVFSACSTKNTEEPSEVELKDLYVPWFESFQDGLIQQLKMSNQMDQFAPWEIKKVEKKECEELSVKKENLMGFDCKIRVTYGAKSHRDDSDDRTIRVFIHTDSKKIEIGNVFFTGREEPYEE